jgi:hypothetical protein
MPPEIVMRRTILALFALATGLCPTSAFASDKPLHQVIDDHMQAAWPREKVTAVPLADDATFLRRVSLDLIGTIPSHDAARQFLDDKAADKRARLIDALLADPRFAAHQADVWDLVLFGRNPGNPDATRVRPGFLKWLTRQFADNIAYDKWVRDLLLAEGNSVDDGPPLFYVQYRGQPEETAEAVTRIFLGTPLNCARCHDHPTESWKQKDFYGMAAFFARLVVVDAGAAGNSRKYMVAEKRTGEVLFTGPAAEQTPGKKGEPVGAKFLGGEALLEPALPMDFKESPLKSPKDIRPPDFSRKARLAEWLTAADNPYFARAAANRVWAQFLRRGLVHPVDNLSPRNQASHPELLGILEKHLTAGRFDLKGYIRELVLSDAYQRASKGPTAEPYWFEQARLRALSAEEMLAALRVATGFDDASRLAGVKPGQEKLPAALPEYVMRYFGSATDGRGDFQASVTERLFVSHSATLRQLIQRRKGNLADTLATSKDPWEQKVERLFLTVLSRPPTAAERTRFVEHLTSSKQSDALIEEAIWALVACAEFRFNH